MILNETNDYINQSFKQAEESKRQKTAEENMHELLSLELDPKPLAPKPKGGKAKKRTASRPSAVAGKPATKAGEAGCGMPEWQADEGKPGSVPHPSAPAPHDADMEPVVPEDSSGLKENWTKVLSNRTSMDRAAARDAGRKGGFPSQNKVHGALREHDDVASVPGYEVLVEYNIDGTDDAGVPAIVPRRVKVDHSIANALLETTDLSPGHPGMDDKKRQVLNTGIPAARSLGFHYIFVGNNLPYNAKIMKEIRRAGGMTVSGIDAGRFDEAYRNFNLAKSVAKALMSTAEQPPDHLQGRIVRHNVPDSIRDLWSI